MKFTKALLGLAAAVFMLSSCNSSNDDPNNGKNVFLNVATLDYSTSIGSKLSLQEIDDSPVITLTTNQQFDPKVFKQGKRLVLVYSSESNEQYVSGPIEVYSAAMTLGEGDPAKTKTAQELKELASEKITMTSVWRTGKYLNFAFKGISAGDPVCDLYVDEATVGTATPEFHIYYKQTTGAGTAEHDFFGSYDISTWWNPSTTESIKVFYVDSDFGGEAVKTIVKKPAEITPNE